MNSAQFLSGEFKSCNLIMKFDKSTVAVAVIVCLATVVLILARIRQTSYLAATVPGVLNVSQATAMKEISSSVGRVLTSKIEGLTFSTEGSFNQSASAVYSLALKKGTLTAIPDIKLFFGQKMAPNVTSFKFTDLESLRIIKDYISSFVNNYRTLFGLGTVAFDQPGVSQALTDCRNRALGLTLTSVQSMINTTVGRNNTVNMYRFFYQPETLPEAIAQNIVAYVLTGITM